MGPTLHAQPTTRALNTADKQELLTLTCVIYTCRDEMVCPAYNDKDVLKNYSG